MAYNSRSKFLEDNMKRLIALLLTLLVVVSLSACTFGSRPLEQKATQAQEDDTPDITKYKKDFAGMQKYLIDMELLPSEGSAKSKTKAEIVGAKAGVRYILDTENFVEFYQFDTKATPDEAQNLFDTVKDGGTYDVLGLTKLKGVVSDSGNFIMLYPADSKYDYAKIADEFKKF